MEDYGMETQAYQGGTKTSTMAMEILMRLFQQNNRQNEINNLQLPTK